MKPTGLDLKSLRYAMALADYKSFRRAADALGISQPGLTKSISNLENSMGVQLFNRTHQGVEPTEYFEHVLEASTDIFLKVAELKNRLHVMADFKHGTLNVGVGQLFSHSNYAYRIREFIIENNDMRINYHVSNPLNLLTLLRNGELHMLITDLSQYYNHPGLEFEKFHTSLAYVFCRPEHPLGKKQSVRFSDIKKFDLVLFQIEETSSEFFKKLGPDSSDVDRYVNNAIRNTTNSHGFLVDMISKTNRITLGSDISFDREVENGSLKRIQLQHHESYASTTSIITVKNRAIPPAAELLREFIWGLADTAGFRGHYRED
jgi:DNA-binding transcriptional LysR family regulator